MSVKQLVRRRTVFVAGALALIGASLAAGQRPAKPPPKDTAAKTKPVTKPAAQNASTTRIKIHKQEAGGDVAPTVKIDSTAACDVIATTVIDPSRETMIRQEQYFLDSVAASLERQRLLHMAQLDMDNLRAQIAADALAKKQAKEQAAAAALRARLARGYYFGIAGGTSAPQRGLRDGYTGGYNVTVPVGFDATDWPLGIRADVSVDHMNGTIVRDVSRVNLAASGDITVWSANTDLKLRVPTPGGGTRAHLYALGGIGAHKVTGGVYGTLDPKAGQNLSFNDASLRFGWNAGAGAAIAWGPTEVFIESRFFQVKSDLAYRTGGGVGTYTTFTPVVIGLQWF